MPDKVKEYSELREVSIRVEGLRGCGSGWCRGGVGRHGDGDAVLSGWCRASRGVARWGLPTDRGVEAV